MLHFSGNCSGAIEDAKKDAVAASPTIMAPPPLATPASYGATFGGAAVVEQAAQIKRSLVSVIHEHLVDKVDDSVVRELLRISEQLDSIGGGANAVAREQRSTQPMSANTRIKTLDLNDIPTLKETGSCAASGDVSRNTCTSAILKRKSVVFFRDQAAIGGAIFEDDGQKFIARSYSGFGSFRRMSRNASMMGGDLMLAHVPQRTLSFRGDGMPTLDLGGEEGGGMRSRFSRPIARHSSAFAEDPFLFAEACASTGATLLSIDVDDADTFLLDIDAGEAEVLKTVAVKVFGQYTFMKHVAAADPSVFLQFIDAISRYNNAANPHRNGIHTADTLISVHQYLKQQDVGNNFTDDEIIALLVSALCVNIGYLGVSNEFLLQFNHPLSRVYSVVNTSESVSTMIGIQLLDQYNFLWPIFASRDEANTSNTAATADTNTGRAVHWLGMQEAIAELLSSTSPRVHQFQLRQAVAFTERGFVSDAEVPTLLSCVLRAAMMRFCCRPKHQHVMCAELWVNEAYKQSEAERIFKLNDEPQWTNDTAWSSVQAYVTAVAMPYFEALQEFLPEDWYTHALAVGTLYGSADSPVANNTASFKDGLADAVSITVDPTIPEWSDKASLSLNVLTSTLDPCWVLVYP